MRIMWKPKYFHEMMTNSAQRTVFGSASQGGTSAPRPTAVSAPSTRPSGWRIRRQTTPAMTSERTYGAKKSSRKQRAARETAG